MKDKKIYLCYIVLTLKKIRNGNIQFRNGWKQFKSR